VRIATWNIHRCFGTDRRYSPERVAEAISEMGADIVALQEVDSSLRVQGEVDQLSYLASATGMTAVMGPTLQRDYGAYGNAILTRHPIENTEELNLSYRRFEPRGALTARLQVGDQVVRVINVHLGLKFWERAFQIERILHSDRWPRERDAPTILLGDFNEWFPFTVNQFRLKRSFNYRSPRANTFPAGWPRFALDRIFLDGKIHSFASRVWQNSRTQVASDHLPVVADIEFSEAANPLIDASRGVIRGCEI
jgi:endonuclease/exonuclease/phosphatase family metal-dependent hydrolase